MTDWFSKNILNDAIRVLFSFLDKIAYWFMSVVYEIFFVVASTDILSGDIVVNIYYRVQVILGVFMVFKLAVSVLQAIVSPDSVFDKKSGKGTGAIITRIVVSLVMLSLISPIKIPNPQNEWEEKVNNNGLLFGTLFSLQNRILSNNTIGRLILGSDEITTNGTSATNLAKIGKTFSSTILKTFVRINVLPTLQQDPGDGKAPETLVANRVCKNIDSSALQTYTNANADAGAILNNINEGCEVNGKKYYAFSYAPIISTIVAVIIDFVLIAYSIDVAIRVFKLAILRLIAPIPIISHMNITSKSAKGEDAFGLWTKSLVTTYLELFIRLAIVYFVLFVISSIISNGFGLKLGSSNFIINTLATVFIIVGLMLFAKQVPNYIKSLFGAQGGKSAGLTAMLTAAGAIRGGQSAPMKILSAVNENVSKESFGDKAGGKGGILSLYSNTSKATSDKIAEKNAKAVQDAYYRRGLDIDGNAKGTRIDENGNRVPFNYTGADGAGVTKRWWANKDANEALNDKILLGNNTKRYDGYRARYSTAEGRGNVVKRGDVNINNGNQNTPTTPTTQPTTQATTQPTTPPTSQPTNPPSNP